MSGEPDTAEAVKPPPTWQGREVRFASVSIGVAKAARKMGGEDALYHVLLNSMVYVDTSKRVFKDMAAIEAVPSVDSYKVLTLSMLAWRANAPPEEDAPDDVVPLP